MLLFMNPDDGSGGGGSGESGGDGEAKTFTKAELDAAVEKVVKERTKEVATKHREANQKLETRLQEALKGQLSASQREDLENQLEEVRGQLRTREEAAAERFKRMEQEHKAKMTEAEKRAAELDTKYRRTTIDRALMDAAAAGKPSSPGAASLIVLALKGSAILDENDNVVVEREVKLEDGTTVKKQLSPKEAVAELEKDVDNFGPLFESGLSSGLGGTSGKDGKEVDIARIPMSQYMELRKTPEGRRRLGLE